MDDGVRLTFLGHSTVLIELDGVRILTDPILFDRVGLLRRVTRSLDPDTYGRIDLVLISHLHLDHFDAPSLRLLARSARAIVPRGAGRLFAPLGFAAVTELDAGGSHIIGAVTITATPARHGSYRPPFGPRAPALGYLIASDTMRIYFAGDTDLFPGMADLAPELDVALLPVWGWGPTLGRGHLDPRRAAQALSLLRPRTAIPIHWGTFWPYGFGRVRTGRLADPPLEFAVLAATVHPETSVLIAPLGEPITVPPGKAIGRTPDT